MKAALFLGQRRLELQELPKPACGPREALVKVLACGVCGTDVHIYRGELAAARPPVVLGHEIFGEIEAVGEEVSQLRPGQRVVLDPFIPCGSCWFCKNGEPRFCRQETFLGYHRHGGFAQYTTAPELNTYPVPEGTGLEAGVLTETLSTVVAGLTRLAPQPGRSFLLLGAGTVGLLWAQLLRRSLPSLLIQTEVVRERLERSRSLGVDRALSPRQEDLSQVVGSLCPDGVDYLIDATGSTEAVAQALPLLKKGGAFLCFGIAPEDERLPLSLSWFYRQQVTFLTSRRPPREMERAIRLLARGAVDARAVVTGRFPLERIEETFRLFHEARDRQLKMAVDPWS
jgi:threonine dehydrogenase-like Zn-dependent dehydrogenase